MINTKKVGDAIYDALVMTDIEVLHMSDEQKLIAAHAAIMAMDDFEQELPPPPQSKNTNLSWNMTVGGNHTELAITFDNSNQTMRFVGLIVGFIATENNRAQ